MTFLLHLFTFLAAYAFMEFMAWFTHKYVMHGILWVLHRDHHVHEEGFFEKNDAFFLIFATPSALCMFLGGHYGYPLLITVGTGILAYGFTYFLVHDVFIHRRFKWFKNSDHPYLMALQRAHRTHHKYVTKEDGECFGMLLVPWRFYQEARQKKARRQESTG